MNAQRSRRRKNPGKIRPDRELVPHKRLVIPSPLLPPETDVRIPFIVANAITTAATFGTQAYKINSLADTNIQYVGLSNFNGYYSKYRVVGVSMHIDFLGQSSTVHTVACASLSPLSTAIASAADVLKCSVMPFSIGATMGLSSGSSIERRRLSASLVNIAGTEEVYTSSTYSASTNAVADPSDLIYLHIGTRSLNGLGNPQAVGYVIRGTMQVKYFERNTTGN